MTYVMEACAENKKQLIVLDRPNPNGFYIDGPVLTNKYKSFLGMHNVPIVYGMTCGEYAKMVNGEGWLKNKVKCKLTVIPLKNYDRTKLVSGLPVKPSPNLPNDDTNITYPSLERICHFNVLVRRFITVVFLILNSHQFPMKFLKSQSIKIHCVLVRT